jgi:hypothetical protein
VANVRGSSGLMLNGKRVSSRASAAATAKPAASPTIAMRKPSLNTKRSSDGPVAPSAKRILNSLTR